MMSFNTRTEAIEACVTDMIRCSDEEGAINVHGAFCDERSGGRCDCNARLLLVPPARVDAIWGWLDVLDVVNRTS